jgi:predicted SprT family Zn-dependent metalloprotease
LKCTLRDFAISSDGIKAWTALPGDSQVEGRGGPHLEVIDLAASSTDEEDEAGGTWILQRSAPRTRPQLIIDDSSESSSDEGYAEEEGPDAFARTIPALQTILRDMVAPAHVATRTPLTAPSPHPLSSLNKGSRAAFAKVRDKRARDLYRRYNSLVFEDSLPQDMDISWNKRLTTTAGLTHYSRENHVLQHIYKARIELSSKVVDNEERLERTLVHEMCHCAAWLMNHQAKPPHGTAFKRWADRAMRLAPHLDISTCHQYEIFYSHRWQCGDCSHIYGRHSNSIDVTRKACGLCRGRLVFLGKFDRNGEVRKMKKPSEFSLYVKANFDKVQKNLPPNAAAADVMKHIAAQWRKQQAP